MPVTTPFIEVKDLNFAYGSHTVLEQVSFIIEKGDYVGIVGPNGGGKTTLLKILVGLLTPQSGAVLIDRQPIGSFKNRFRIGYVPQRVSQENRNFPATVYEVVESGRVPQTRVFGGLNQQDRQAIATSLATAHIEELQDTLLSRLSGGQRQRVYVARALAADPEILILDEPFVGVDISAQKDFYDFLKELNHTQGLTILFVSHDIDVITEEVTSILCLNRGLLCAGSPSMLHEPNVIEELYGKKITHIHRHH
jgi:zinc transport system ATP-binding protein